MSDNNSSEKITDWDAYTLSENIRSKQVSCREVMEAYLNRIKDINPNFNAIIALEKKDKLLKEASQKDGELAKGEYKGWMHGFPHAVKDLANTKGLKTTFGSPLLKGFTPDEDQIIVERIKAAGAIIIGKTNVPEFGLGCQTYNTVYGTTANAYDPDKSSGGSSGGAAVALAKNMVPVADGSDMAGSLRNPASFNNVVGFRPTQGLVPYWPTEDPNAPSLATEGPMARNVKDVSLLLSTMAGYDPRVPNSLKVDNETFSQSLGMDFKSIKLGWLKDFEGFLPLEIGILEICENALGKFETKGLNIDFSKTDVPPKTGWEAWLDLRCLQVGRLLHALYEDKDKRKLIKPEAIWEIERMLNLPEKNFQDALHNQSIWNKSINKLFEKYNFLILPGSQVWPFDKNIHWPEEISGQKMVTYHQWMAVYCLITITGCPVLSLPIGFNENGLPMGIQIIGPKGKDFEVLKIANVLEKLLIP